MGTYCWCVHVLQTSTLCEGSSTHRPLLVYRFSAAALHNSMPDSFSLDTYHLEHICEDTQSRIFELCSSRGGLKFRRAAISSKWERRVGDRGADPLPFDNNFTKERPTDSLVGGSHLRGGVTGVSIVLSRVPDAPNGPFHRQARATQCLC